MKLENDKEKRDEREDKTKPRSSFTFKDSFPCKSKYE